MAAVCAATLPASGFYQQPSANPAAEAGTGHKVVSRLPGDMLAQFSDSLEQLASKASRAVVQIEVSGFGPAEEGGSEADPRSERGRKNTAVIVRQHAIGSGVIVDPDGYIMTNAHVVEGAQRIRVALWLPPATFDPVTSPGNVQVLNAKVIGLQKEVDLALLKVEASSLPTLHFRLDAAQPGELVFAIGSPGGLQNSVSMGVISSAWRQPNPDNPMVYLQTDAPINPGNSGGPLVDVTGAVVGLNTFILSSSGGSEGLGFAIPARVVDFVYQSLRKYGHVYRTEIGAVAQTITPAIAEGLGLAQKWGVVIADVAPHGPADTAGIRPEDVLLAIDGHPVLTLLAFTAALYQHSPDQVLRIDVLRGAQKVSFIVPAMLARDHMSQLADVADPMKSHIGPLGILGLDFNDELRSLLPDVRIATGVIVIGQAPGFNSVNTGLQVGDVIHSLNRTTVESVDQLKSSVAQLKPGDAAVLRIERRGQFQYLAFEME
ncbi:MAG: trypsin-like peptidase domain-containing protein [Acidobacteriaceae bacterium]|nr:trypsin-like peptidase domain-containing protein [Acidobacteriaceae bacterium]